eukprot:jgi/Psemu1/220527/e_gw1.1046.12.1
MSDQNGFNETSPLIGNQSGTNVTVVQPAKRSGRSKMKNVVVELTVESAIDFKRLVSKNMVQQKLTAKAFYWQQFWIFDFPQSFLTFASTLLAFGGSLIDVGIDTNIIAGGCSALVVMLQTLSRICNYGSKADMHFHAAIDMRDLRGDLIAVKHKLLHKEKQKQSKNEETEDIGFTSKTYVDGSDSEDSDSTYRPRGKKEETFSSIQTRFLQTLSGCKSYVPIEISEAFNELDAALILAQSKENFGLLDSVISDVDVDDFIYSQAYDILSGEIVRHHFFPMSLPKSEIVVSRTMERLRLQLKQYSRYWDLKNLDVDGSCFMC